MGKRQDATPRNQPRRDRQGATAGSSRGAASARRTSDGRSRASQVANQATREQGDSALTRRAQISSTAGKMRRTPYRIAHFGDLHLGDFDAEFEWTLDMVDDAFERGANHVVFTGDIVDAAEVDVIEGLVRELDKRGHGPRQISLVPGNHDIYPLSWPLKLRWATSGTAS